MSRHLKKILKLRQIFLEFDEDGSRKMELDEMEEMFHKNKLFVSTQELIDLFFKGQRISKNAVKSLYLVPVNLPCATSIISLFLTIFVP